MIPAFFSKVTPLKPVFRHVDATGQPVNPVYTQTLPQTKNQTTRRNGFYVTICFREDIWLRQ